MRYQNCRELINDLKRSLVDPNGNFVNIPGYVGGDASVVMSEDELRRVQDQSYDQDDYDDDDYGDDYDNDYDDNDYDDDYDQSDYDDDDYDDRAYDSRQRRDGKNGRKNGVDPNTRKIHEDPFGCGDRGVCDRYDLCDRSGCRDVQVESESHG